MKLKHEWKSRPSSWLLPTDAFSFFPDERKRSSWPRAPLLSRSLFVWSKTGGQNWAHSFSFVLLSSLIWERTWLNLVVRLVSLIGASYHIKLLLGDSIWVFFSLWNSIWPEDYTDGAIRHTIKGVSVCLSKMLIVCWLQIWNRLRGNELSKTCN